MRFWLLPWSWEEDSNAMRLLGIPIASNFSSSQLQDHIHTKISTRLNQMKLRHLSLAGRVTVADGLFMSTIWYFITLWAGDLGFFTKLQSLIETFVWSGTSRVSRNSVTQSKAKGGLGLLLIGEQFRSSAGNLMIWVLGKEPHPLRNILSSHIRVLSCRHWGYPDFTWIVSKGAVRTHWVLLPGATFAEPGRFRSHVYLPGPHAMMMNGGSSLC